VTGLSTLQIEAILAHELAHIRRHDYLVSLFQSAMETVFFYHPAVWWVSNRMRCEREHCCDDLAVALCGDGIAYARALSFLEERRSPAVAGALGATGGELKMRIARLLNVNQSPVSRRTPAVILLLFAAALAGLAAWGSARAQSTAPQPPAAPQQGSVPTPPIGSLSAQPPAAPHQSSVPTPPINSQSAQPPAAPAPPIDSQSAVAPADTSQTEPAEESRLYEAISDQRTPDLSCTYYGPETETERDGERRRMGHPGDCEGSIAGTQIFYCRQRDGDRLREVQIGCKWKVEQLRDWELQHQESIRKACSHIRCS
jgi:hypothetical protein